MNFKFFLPIAALGIFGACASHEGINEKDGTFELTTDKGIVSVTPLSDDIFRITTRPADAELTYRPSQSAILSPSDTKIKGIFRQGGLYSRRRHHNDKG